MSRIPPSLLYLTIYNPTLKPLPLDPDNEDAEEQAHVLFYTAREHAVSRDRILRQVGLAKALVNFSEVFNPAVPCENVHSQARRMVMFSPEPDFWMHACYEVAKTPRVLPADNKDASKGKTKGKGKGKEQASRPAVIYDYHDGSIHDVALHTHFQRGYDEFKLLHGPFGHILAKSGQEALEIQLERFFTVWAWKWDVEDDDFGTLLGLPLHPLHAKLTPLLDKFISSLPDEFMTFALMSPYVIPPRTPRYPSSLFRYILTRIPPLATPVSSTQVATPTTTFTIPGQTQTTTIASDGRPLAQSAGALTMPLTMPAMPTMPTMNFTLDIKGMKWGWLTFGKGGGSAKAPSTQPSTSSPISPSLVTVVEDTKGDTVPADEESRPSPPGRDTLDVASLLDAMTTNNTESYSRATSPAPSTLSLARSTGLEESSIHDEISTSGHVSPIEPSELPEALPPSAETDMSENSQSPGFLSFPVYLDVPDDPLTPQWKRVLHLSKGEFTVAIVIDMHHTLELLRLADEVLAFIDELQTTVADELRTADQQLPSAAKLLQPKDRYIVSSDEYTMTAPSVGFMSRSEHLCGQQLLRSLDIHEVFSRGQNPQHWHVGKRGLGKTAEGHQIEGEVYIEVARKETTLTDVDNELVRLVRRYAEQA